MLFLRFILMGNRRFLNLKTIFIDDTRVINDNNIRTSQWKSLIGQFFSPRFGGSLRAWASANEYALTQLMHRFKQNFKANSQLNYKEFYAKEQIIWLITCFKWLISIPHATTRDLKLLEKLLIGLFPRSTRHIQVSLRPSTFSTTKVTPFTPRQVRSCGN